MKVIAMYLPQFHRVKENDEWWGEGFTDWTTVRQAKPLFEGHQQPRVPQEENYYDLLDKKTMQWQASLMKEYGIDGMCMYHYWFKEGRQILEKPVENLLKWKDVDMPFCLCWANETWARSWSGLENINVWADTCESEKKLGEKILLEQKYGNYEEWKKHFEYLLPFFRDERYIKIDGKPVFVFYKSKFISCFENMVEAWQNLAVEHGLKGVYVIANEPKMSSRPYIDTVLLHNPANLFVNYDRSQIVKEENAWANVLNYDLIWEKILSKAVAKNTIVGGFVGYDDTPRRGKNGIVCVGATADKFKKYFAKLLAKNYCLGNEMVFLNAWNEWGEGMCLEPDQENGECFLEAVRDAKEIYPQFIDEYESQKSVTEVFKWQIANERNSHYCKIMDDWLYLLEKNIEIEKYLYKQGYRKIALYGYGLLGKHFENQISDVLVKIDYIIDKNKDNAIAKKRVYGLEEDFPNVDAVVVSPTYSYGEILGVLRQKGINEVISLEHIIEELRNAR